MTLNKNPLFYYQMILKQNQRRWIYILIILSVVTLRFPSQAKKKHNTSHPENASNPKNNIFQKIRSSGKFPASDKETCLCQTNYEHHVNKTVENVRDQPSFTERTYGYLVQSVENFREWFVAASIQHFPIQMSRVISIYYPFFKVLLSPQPEKHRYYHVNFASSQGGAKILMESSKRLHSTSKILQEKLGNYMYTDLPTPFSFIIGLTEEVVIKEIVLTSTQMYSRFTKDILFEGKFTLKDPSWVQLGNYRLVQSFDPQFFQTEKKIVRYLRVTVLSHYEQWNYFTLSQLQVHGKGLFADAVTEEEDKKKPSASKIWSEENDKCLNEFAKSQSEKGSKPYQSNLITDLLRKIEQLEYRNLDLHQKLREINRESIDFEDLIQQHKQSRKLQYYALIVSALLSLISITALCCLCQMQGKKAKSKSKVSQNGIFYDYKSERPINLVK